MITAERMDRQVRHSTYADASGAFHLEGLVPGTYKVDLFSFPGDTPAQASTAKVTAGKRARVTLRSVGPTVKVQIHAIDGSCQAVWFKRAGESEPDPSFMSLCENGLADTKLEAGSYEACIDATACTPIVVVPGKPEQKFDIHGRTH